LKDRDNAGQLVHW